MTLISRWLNVESGETISYFWNESRVEVDMWIGEDGPSSMTYDGYQMLVRNMKIAGFYKHLEDGDTSRLNLRSPEPPKRGRPLQSAPADKGSSTNADGAPKRKRGRPKGSKNKPKAA